MMNKFDNGCMERTFSKNLPVETCTFLSSKTETIFMYCVPNILCEEGCF